MNRGIGLRLHDDDRVALELLAAERSCALSDVIRAAIRFYIEAETTTEASPWRSSR